jgi:hypothetical protein
MGVHAPTKLFNLLGFVLWGDLADLTMYRSHRAKLVVFAKTYPDTTPSEDQLTCRTAFKAAATAWKALTHAQRLQWYTAAAHASLCATGYNAYLHFKLKPDAQALATLARQTGTTLTL